MPECGERRRRKRRRRRKWRKSVKPAKPDEAEEAEETEEIGKTGRLSVNKLRAEPLNCFQHLASSLWNMEHGT
jgi:hypothetical protein